MIRYTIHDEIGGGRLVLHDSLRDDEHEYGNKGTFMAIAKRNLRQAEESKALYEYMIANNLGDKKLNETRLSESLEKISDCQKLLDNIKSEHL